MDNIDVDLILNEHKQWMVSAGVLGRRATFEGRNMNGANLRGADLCRADLHRAYLMEINLQKANLVMADMRVTSLWKSDLSGALMHSADISHSDLREANLTDTILKNANLKSTNLEGANLERAYLSGATLDGAVLRGANIKGATLPKYKIVPEEGEFVAWKAGCRYLIKLLIPSTAERTSCLTSRKCRVSEAKVLGIYTPKGEETEEKRCEGWRKTGFFYEVGEVAKPDKFCTDIRIDCSHGIHIFLTKEEAMYWMGV
jgi:hypothetical protein